MLTMIWLVQCCRSTPTAAVNSTDMPPRWLKITMTKYGHIWPYDHTKTRSSSYSQPFLPPLAGLPVGSTARIFLQVPNEVTDGTNGIKYQVPGGTYEVAMIWSANSITYHVSDGTNKEPMVWGTNYLMVPINEVPSIPWYQCNGNSRVSRKTLFF